LNTTLLLLAVLNVTQGTPFYECELHSVVYQMRVGSLLATDFLAWLFSSLTDKVYCYSGRILLPPNSTLRYSNATVATLFSHLPKVRNVEELRIKGEWYYVMLSSTEYSKNAEEAFSCLKKWDDLRALYCFLKLRGYYERLYAGRVAVVRNPCLAGTEDPGELWALASIAKRLRGGNQTLALNALFSYYAYVAYYNASDVEFARMLVAALTRGLCSPLEASLALLCKLATPDWRSCYALLTFLLWR